MHTTILEGTRGANSLYSSISLSTEGISFGTGRDQYSPANANKEAKTGAADAPGGKYPIGTSAKIKVPAVAAPKRTEQGDVLLSSVASYH